MDNCSENNKTSNYVLPNLNSLLVTYMTTNPAKSNNILQQSKDGIVIQTLKLDV